MFKQLVTNKFSNKHLIIAQGIAIISTAILFLFLRIYKIDTSLLFFNDIGRDFLVLFNWQESGKPPLLGPQTSALPYNQSTVYFYLLYPIFILSNHSPFATIITCVIFYLAIFSLGLVYLNKHKFLQRSFLLSFFLLTIHPQVITQNRFVWNPSFTIPLILISFYSFYLLQEKFNKKNLLIFVLSLALAVSLSYSIAPLLIAFMLLSLVLFWKQYRFFIIWLMTGISLFSWNLPAVAFELRHNFLLTNLLIHGEKLQQTAISLSQKIADTLYFAFYNHNPKQTLALLLLLATLAGINVYYKKKEKLYKEPLTQALALLFLTIVVTFFVPVSMQAHYIFAILTLGPIIISLFNWLSFTLATICLSLIYLSPNQLNSYFTPAKLASISQWYGV